MLRGSGKATSVSPRRLPAGLILREVQYAVVQYVATVVVLSTDWRRRLMRDDSFLGAVLALLLSVTFVLLVLEVIFVALYTSNIRRRGGFGRCTIQ